LTQSQKLTVVQNTEKPLSDKLSFFHVFQQVFSQEKELDLPLIIIKL